MNPIVCAYRKCDVVFTPRRHNQVYCTPEHCREETNIRLKETYHENKARRAGNKRTCKCGTLLSRYNDSKTCAKCQAQERRRKAERDYQIYNG